MSMDDDPAGADLVAVDEQSWRDELERHSSMRHAIRPSLAEAPTHLESLGIHLKLHQLRARAKLPRLFTVCVPRTALCKIVSLASPEVQKTGTAPQPIKLTILLWIFKIALDRMLYR